MSQHTKQQLIDLAIDRNIPYYRLTKAQLASKLNITITPKPPQTPQQKKDYRAAYRLKKPRPRHSLRPRILLKKPRHHQPESL